MKKGDILIIAALCVISLLLFIPSFTVSDEKIASVYLDGELKEEIDLSAAKEAYTVEVGGCTLKIENGAVTFSESDCPDRLCVKRGSLSRSGDIMACVPNRVVVSIRGGSHSDFDAVAY